MHQSTTNPQGDMLLRKFGKIGMDCRHDVSVAELMIVFIIAASKKICMNRLAAFNSPRADHGSNYERPNQISVGLIKHRKR